MALALRVAEQIEANLCGLRRLKQIRRDTPQLECAVQLHGGEKEGHMDAQAVMSSSRSNRTRWTNLESTHSQVNKDHRSDPGLYL